MFLAVWTGLEPATPCVTGRYSNQLNYHTIYMSADLLDLAQFSRHFGIYRPTKKHSVFFRYFGLGYHCNYHCFL